MTAASPKSPAPVSPSRTSNTTTNNNSAQMQGVFGRCAEPVPANVASARKQQLAAQKSKSDMTPAAGTKLQGDEGYNGCQKTVGKPQAFPTLKRKPGSTPLAEVTIFSPPEPVVHKPRATQHHTDPFSETRIRDEGHKRKVLVPESTTKKPKAQSVRVSANTKAKWEAPFAADAEMNESMSPSPLSPSRSSAAHSPAQLGKKCTRAQEGSEIFSSPASPLSPASESRASSLRYKHSSVGDTTMFNEPTEVELSKDRMAHKKPIPQKQSMEGVFTPLEKKNRHPNYKFQAPFARQGSVAATARIGGRRHQKQAAGVKEGEIVSPFASTTDANATAALPAENTGSRPKKVFSEKHSSKTPFARHNSFNVSKKPNASKRFYNQAPTSPFATHEGLEPKCLDSK